MLTVITGAPCSGKTTYVREHAKPGDIVIDFDELARALGSPRDHDHARPLFYVTLAARTAAIDEAITQHRKGHRAWVIDTELPAASPLRAAATDIVALDTEPSELHRRASAGRPERWHQLIDDWLAAHPPAPAAVHQAEPVSGDEREPARWQPEASAVRHSRW